MTVFIWEPKIELPHTSFATQKMIDVVIHTLTVPNRHIADCLVIVTTTSTAQALQ